MNAIKPVFRDLAHSVLLSKCLSGYTQNTNEALNNIIWKFCPKKKNYGLRTVQTGVALVSLFNDGNVAFIKVMERLGLEAGQFSRQCFVDRDMRRI